MNKTVLTGVSVVTIFLLLIINLQSAVATPAGWSNDIRLTYNGDNRDPTIAVNGNNVHIVWENMSDGELYYCKSGDYGNIWTTETNITRSAADPLLPDIAINSSTIHVVFEDNYNTREEIFYLRSEDNGQSWTEEVVISENNASWSQWPSVGCEGNNVYAVFGDERDGEYEIYFKRSFDGGNTWSNDKRLTVHQTGTDSGPAIIATPTKLHLVYRERTGGAPSTFEVMYMNSTDGGSSWSTPVMLSSDNGAHSEFYGPNCFAVDGDDIHVVWEDQRHSDYGELYYRRSTDGGISWESEVRLLDRTSDAQEQPRVCAQNDFVQVFWGDSRNKGRFFYDVYSMNSTDGGIIWNSDYRVTEQPWPVNSGLYGACIDEGYTHIIFMDNRTEDNDDEIYYKRNPDFISVPEFPNLLLPILSTIFIVTVASRVHFKRRR